ncbi:MAG TPA: UMP kinase [Candidatus Moranbacteria bacterium]|nr:UMP kinase [Candidatus Moranbacteria bacterium]
MKNNIIVISLGGSLIVPKQIDWQFLKKFRELIISEIAKGKRFAIITGGGYTCREYQQAATKVTNLTKDDRDWLGIHTSRLNAHLIKTIFRKYANPRINKNPRTKEDLTKSFSKGEGIMVAAGWRPGWSTDYVATIIAERLGAKKLINLSNIKYACDKDPKKHKDAKIIKEINWKNFRKIVGNVWDPGMNLPFDPVASKLAEKINLEVIITEGKNIENLRNILEEKKFLGTVIK